MSHNVSVIIPNYNHASFLRDRIETVLHQTLKPFEIIILDDCSTDNSVEIINKYVEKNPEIIFIKNEKNSGSTFAQWNKAVALAKGNLIWIAESDDTANASFLERVVSTFQNNKNIVLAYSQSNKTNEKGEIIGNWINHTEEFDKELFKNNFEMSGSDFIQKFLIHKNCIPNASAVVFKKDIYLQTNGATESLKNHGDWLVWLKLLCIGDLCFISDSLNNFRYHRNSVIAKSHASSTIAYKDLYGFEVRKEFDKFLSHSKISLSKNMLNINAQYLAINKGHYGLYLLKNKKYFGAWANILEATFKPKFQSYFVKKALGFSI